MNSEEFFLWWVCILGMAFASVIFYAFMRAVLNDFKSSGEE